MTNCTRRIGSVEEKRVGCLIGILLQGNSSGTPTTVLPVVSVTTTSLSDRHCCMHLVPRMATALVFFIYVSNEGLEQANAQYYTSGINSREMRMCGPMLTNTLELVCQGRFNTINKKAQDSESRSQAWTNNDRDNFALFPFRSRRNALSFNSANAFRRRTRNVVDECCHVKSCTIAEMKHYCERI